MQQKRNLKQNELNYLVHTIIESIKRKLSFQVKEYQEKIDRPEQIRLKCQYSCELLDIFCSPIEVKNILNECLDFYKLEFTKYMNSANSKPPNNFLKIKFIEIYGKELETVLQHYIYYYGYKANKIIEALFYFYEMNGEDKKMYQKKVQDLIGDKL